MKLSSIINYPLGLLGLRITRRTRNTVAEEQAASPDIARDSSFLQIYKKVKPFTMVDIERCYALYRSVQYIIRNNIPGDFVECGVWKGGSCMLIAYTLEAAKVSDRDIWLYDTFAGMTQPGINDGTKELTEWEQQQITGDKNGWCLASREEAEANLRATGYPAAHVHFVKGKVEDRIPATVPAKISLLRLDTDWYESTRHELVHLYPLLQKGGILIIDDYGAWQGARKATDEYFDNKVFLSRIDWSARLLVKN